MAEKAAWLERIGDRLLRPNARGRSAWRWLVWLLLALLLLDLVVGCYWSDEPATFKVGGRESAVPGAVTTATLIREVEILLNKPGGYLRNDILPHHLWLDNLPSWEYGVLLQIRDLTQVLRRVMSAGPSRDPALATAVSRFRFDADSWIMPSTESVYRHGLQALREYHQRLTGPGEAQFQVSAKSLDAWLARVQAQLSHLAHALSRSVGGVGLASGELALKQRPAKKLTMKPTPWLKVDNVFYRARGATWALLHLMKAVGQDFARVLQRHHASTNYWRAVRALRATQAPIQSPFILNGSVFGILANHSLVMAHYISRAHAALTEVRQKLADSQA